MNTYILKIDDNSEKTQQELNRALHRLCKDTGTRAFLFELNETGASEADKILETVDNHELPSYLKGLE